MATKNNPKNRGAAGKIKSVNSKTVKPVLYIGTQIGHGKYIAAQFEGGDLVMDDAGKPIPWDAI
ncbi:MAG: hypothetical protein K0R63_228 [Rickettsiales bacterium]|jgi:hypothetical protein|nr:hypothetical protein [Rickettsiales bacterium]